MLQTCVISSEHLILSSPPSTPPTTSITADDFATFSQTKLEQSVVSFHLHTHKTSNQLHPLLKLPSSPSVPSLRRKYPNFFLSSHPRTCPLDLSLAPSPSNLSLHSYQHSHTSSTHLSSQASPHCIQAGSGNPTAQKTYIKHFSFRKLQTYLSPTIHSQNTRIVVFNQVSWFLSQNNKLEH